MKAHEIIKTASEVLAERGAERDQNGERSMARAVHIFNAMAPEDGLSMTEKEGWLFMIALKLARAERSDNPDHYVDLVGYIALLGEHVLSGNQKNKAEKDERWIARPSYNVQKTNSVAEKKPIDDEGWIEWRGQQPKHGPSEIPIKENVEVRFNNGETSVGPRYAWNWNTGFKPFTIAAYRPVKENPE
jgi:hypothetical protein